MRIRSYFLTSTLLLGASFSTMPLLASENGLGVYSGNIEVFDDPENPIPLSVSIELSGEVTTDGQGNEVGVLDGAFIIDGEGGPYIFTRLTINDIDGRIDFRYDRPADLGSNIPAAFRLVGYLDADGAISGRVLSGSRGHIGDFALTKDSVRHLKTVPTYDGRWAGYAEMPSGHKVPFHIELASGLKDTINPEHNEFEFTPGKIANIRWNNIKLSMDDVVIDYLQRRVTLGKLDTNGGSAGLVIEYSIDMETKRIEGFINGAQSGRVGSFSLERSPDRHSAATREGF